MLQKPIETVKSPFEGLKVGGYDIRPGMLLFKPNAGVVVVSGIQSFEVEGVSMQTLKMHEIGKLDRTHTPPINMLEKNGVRLTSTAEQAMKSLKTLTKPIKKKGGLWTRKEKEYKERLSIGDISSLIEVVHAIYGPYRGQDFKAAELSYSERMIGEDAMQWLADEISVSINFKPGKAKEAIQNLVMLSKPKGLTFIEDLAKYQKKYHPYIDDETFEECFGVNVETAYTGASAVVQSSASLKPTERPVSQFPAVTGYIPHVFEKPNKTKTPTKIRMGAKPKTKKNVAVKPENRELYAEHINDFHAKSPRKKAFTLSAGLLDAQAFELHTRIYYLDDNKTIADAAKHMGLSLDEAIEIHDKSVDTLRTAYPDGASSRRVNNFLRKHDEQKTSAKRPSTRAKIERKKLTNRADDVRPENKELFKEFIDTIQPKGMLRRAFFMSSQHLNREAFELHMRMYYLPEKMSIEDAAQNMGLSLDRAKEIHDYSTVTLRPHFGNNGFLKRVPAFLKTVADNEANSTPSSPKPKMVRYMVEIPEDMAQEGVVVSFQIAAKGAQPVAIIDAEYSKQVKIKPRMR